MGAHPVPVGKAPVDHEHPALPAGKAGRLSPRGEGPGRGNPLPGLPQGLQIEPGVLLQGEGLGLKGALLLPGPEEKGPGRLEGAVALHEEDPGAGPPPVPEEPDRPVLGPSREVHPDLPGLRFFQSLF